MKIVLIALMTIVIPTCAIAEDSDFYCRSDEVFALKVEKSFEYSPEFKFCHESKLNPWFLLARSTKDNTTLPTAKFAVNKAQADQIVDLYEKSLEFNTKDYSSELSMDGDNWCLITDRGDLHLTACFYEPRERMTERKTSGIYSLGIFLWGLTNKDDKYDPL